jgi:hypothetical protein
LDKELGATGIFEWGTNVTEHTFEKDHCGFCAEPFLRAGVEAGDLIKQLV